LPILLFLLACTSVVRSQIPLTLYLAYPTNNQTFTAPANIYVHAAMTDSNLVNAVQYFANDQSIGIISSSAGVLVTNTSTGNPFAMVWSNAPAGSYALHAVMLDNVGDIITSAPVNITVTSPPPPPPVPFYVTFWYPTNGETFTGPANIGVHALVTDSNIVNVVQYFANGASIGVVSNKTGVLLTNTATDSPFYMLWSNVPPGGYVLQAVALDSAGLTATSAPVDITVTNRPPPPPVPFAVTLFAPTNGQTFTLPATIYVHAAVTDSNLIKAIQYFANDASIGIITNSAGVLLTNTSSGNPFALFWTNPPAGSYALHAVAFDSAGLTATSAPVNITVTNPPPPPPVPFVVTLFAPTNGQTFTLPTNIYVHAAVTDSNLIKAIQYFANGASIGIVTNSAGVLLTNLTSGNTFYLSWSNPPAGGYTLYAVAFDSAGLTATSAPVNITVTNRPPPPPVPFYVAFYYPTNGQTCVAPANIGVHALVTDSNVVNAVQYFANGASIGIISNTAGVLLTSTTAGNPFFLDWSNVPPGDYALQAVAFDNAGLTATSAPVEIFVLTSPPPVVTIYAPDPVAVEGTNYPAWLSPTATASTNYWSGTNTATFLVRRDSGTNVDLTVHYTIGGTASNGVDYVAIPSSLTIPAGQRYALITIVPLEDDANTNRYDTVVLSLLALPTAFDSPLAYSIGSPSRAGAVILEDNVLPITQPLVHSLADHVMHISLPATNGMNFCLQVTSNYVNWTSICTNTVLKGSAQFVDPDGSVNPNLFYRIVPTAQPPAY
jgi:cupin superfamily acireductone dioxygenase involved in methionine salvage